MQFRPNEQKAALEYYENNLNRMTYNDLIKSVDNAGFEILSFSPWANQGRVFQMDQVVFQQTRKVYPKVTTMDLMADVVWILLRKPI